MADFQQSLSTRQAMSDAARAYINQHILSGSSTARAAQYGVSQRTVNRWRAFITGSGSQKRAPNLAKVAAVAPSIHVNVVADFKVGDDPKYERLQKPMEADVTGDSLLQLALNDPDEAWEAFFDEYAIPSGTAEHVTIFFR